MRDEERDMERGREKKGKIGKKMIEDRGEKKRVREVKSSLCEREREMWYRNA